MGAERRGPATGLAAVTVTAWLLLSACGGDSSTSDAPEAEALGVSTERGEPDGAPRTTSTDASTTTSTTVPTPETSLPAAPSTTVPSTPSTTAPAPDADPAPAPATTAPAPDPVTTTAPPPPSVEPQPTTGTVDGTIEVPNGASFVRLVLEDGAGAEVASVEAEADTPFSFDDLPPGSYRLISETYDAGSPGEGDSETGSVTIERTAPFEVAAGTRTTFTCSGACEPT